MSNSNISTGAIIRTVVLIVALINQVLTMTGHSVLPFDERQITALENCRWWELDRHELADRIGELDALLQNPENPK